MLYTPENYALGDWDSLLSRWQSSCYYSLFTAEKEASEAEEQGTVRSYSPFLIPGTLQTIPYMNALCIGANQDSALTHQNYVCKLTRQALLVKAGVRQEFFVRETALYTWPGTFLQPVRAQLQNILSLLMQNKTNSSDQPLYDFRIIPEHIAPPPQAKNDSFYLCETPDKTRAFIESFDPKGCTEVTATSETKRLLDLWSEIGSKALSHEKSMTNLEAAIAKMS